MPYHQNPAPLEDGPLIDYCLGCIVLAQSKIHERLKDQKRTEIEKDKENKHKIC